MIKNRIIFALFALFGFCVAASSQQPCKAPEILLNRSQSNIFNEEQEMILGDVIADYFQKNYRIIRDDEANRYLRAIGERLVAHLPPTSIKFQFVVVDRPELNAFASAGGRIYVTRKMIAFVRNEDELAGIIGHELGHGIVRHSSIDMTRNFKELLGIREVGDQKDIFEKFNRMIDNQRTKRLRPRRGHEDDQQLEADKIGFYAMAAAGYDPKAIVTAWDRLAETEGRTGGGLAGIFTGTKPEEKRLRELTKALESLPADCLDKRATGSVADFEKWRSYVVTRSSFEKEERLPGLIVKRSLTTPLRGDVTHFQFSPDGKYVLAQDDSGINVLRREPFSVLFRIDTTNAKPAKFSPDSKSVVFSTYGLRVEKWDLETRKPLLAREVYVRGRCWQSEISRDGNTLACYSTNANLELIDVGTNESVAKKEKFHVPDYFEAVGWSKRLNESGDKEIDALQMEFSPDGRYFLGGVVSRVWRIVGSTVMQIPSLMASRDQKTFAFDLTERTEVKLGGDLKKIVAMPCAFYSNDKIIGQHASDQDKSGIFMFPSGERVEKFLLGANSFSRPFSGDYLFVRPTSSNPVGVYDIGEKKFIANNKTTAMDGFGEFFVSESKDGVVGLFRYDKATSKMDEIANVTLPKSNFSSPRTVGVSSDTNWLVLSERSRGAVWDLRNGSMKVYLRGFSGSYFDGDGGIYTDLPSFEGEKRAIGMIDPIKNVAGRLEVNPPAGSRQYGKYLVRFRTKRQEETEKRMKEAAAKRAASKGSSEDGPGSRTAGTQTTIPLFFGRSFFDIRRLLESDGTLEVDDIRTGARLWSKYYANEPPTYQFDPTGDSAVLYWRVTAKTAKEEIGKHPDLSQRLKALGERDGDYLIQVVDNTNGTLKGQTLIETGEGSFSIERVFSKGDWITVIDSEDRVLMYSLKDGELKYRFFGENAAINPHDGIVVVENVPGQLSIYSLEDGDKVNELAFAGDVVYSTFSPDGKKLFVLSADQQYYIFDSATLKKSK